MNTLVRRQKQARRHSYRLRAKGDNVHQSDAALMFPLLWQWEKHGRLFHIFTTSHPAEAGAISLVSPYCSLRRVLVESAYKFDVWATTNELPIEVPPPQDPDSWSRTLPHCAIIKFVLWVFPASILCLWLFNHGVPYPKGSTRKDLIEQVQRVRDLKQPLKDEERFTPNNAATSKSYVSIDKITVRLCHQRTSYRTDFHVQYKYGSGTLVNVNYQAVFLVG